MNLINLTTANADANGSVTNHYTWTVPANTAWRVLFGHVAFTSSATAGNRQVNVLIKDENGVEVNSSFSGAVQAASLTRHYVMKQGVYRETSFTSGELEIPIAAQLILPAGWTIEVIDDTDVDDTGDTMIIGIAVDKGNLSAMRV